MDSTSPESQLSSHPSSFSTVNQCSLPSPSSSLVSLERYPPTAISQENAVIQRTNQSTVILRVSSATARFFAKTSYRQAPGEKGIIMPSRYINRKWYTAWQSLLSNRFQESTVRGGR